jgi:tetratricopeptide (TPR) repeat protein
LTTHNTISDLLALAYTLLPNNDKRSAEELGRIGIELESRSRLAHARVILERALQIDPLAHPEWYLSLAFAHFREVAGNFAADGERIIIDGIEETDSDFLKASYLSVLEGGDSAELADMIDYLATSDDVAVRFALGHSLLWRGEQERALTLLRETVEMLGEGEVSLGLDSYCGAMNWMRGQGMAIDLEHEVLPYLERLIHFAPNVYNYRALKIQMYQTLKQYDKVKAAALQALETFPDEETTMVALASACEKLGNDNSAILWYNRAIGAKPSYARARIMLGRLYERLGIMPQAEQVFREIASAFPEYYAGKLEIAYFLKRIGKNAEATSLFRYAYDHLKTFEKAAVEQHPEGKQFMAEMFSMDLPIVMN